MNMKKCLRALRRALPLAVLLGIAAFPAYAVPLSADSGGETALRPIAERLDTMTYQGVRMQGTLRATAPEGGALTFEVVEQPKKGTVTLQKNDSSAFIYAPKEGKAGKDTFTFLARDENGVASAPAVVTIDILKGKTGVRYADMEDHAAHAAAICLAESGVFTGSRTDGVYFFRPEQTVSRGEFLAMAMAAVGDETAAPTAVTGFGDDGDIPAWAKPYAAEARSCGVIDGKRENGKVVFSAGETITCGEAAVILNRLLAVTDVDAAAFAEKDVPAWAAQSVANLMSLRVLPDGADPAAQLDRAAAAEMLCAAMDLMEVDSGGPFGWLK